MISVGASGVDLPGPGGELVRHEGEHSLSHPLIQAMLKDSGE